MNNNSGHIYVLINYSMENLIKIGKTSREPEERAKELSSATGVPTPFIVAYDAFFHNCSEAENYIHKKLEYLGYRLSKNREFFQAPLKEIINIVFEAQNVLNSQLPSEEDQPFNVSDEMIDEEKASFSDLEELAYYYLDCDDHAKAYQLLNQAASLGSNTAYYWLGIMTLYGWGCLEDQQDAIDFLSKGVEHDDVRCYGKLSVLYGENDVLTSDSKFQNDGALGKYKWSNITTGKTWFDNYLEHKDFLLPHDSRASNIIHYFITKGLHYNFSTDSGPIAEDILLKHKKILSNIKDELLNYVIKQKEKLGNDNDFKQLLLKIGKEIKDTL